MIWEEYKNEFEPDGRLRDLYIKDIDLYGWQSFIDFLRSTDAALDYYIEGVAADLPASIDKVVLDQDHPLLLSIHFHTLSCNIFVYSTNHHFNSLHY